MSGCPHEHRLGAFYDRELPPEEAGALEAHVRTCPACAASIQELREVSTLISGASAPIMSAGLRRRIEQIPSLDRDRALARITGALTAVAAALLVAGIVSLIAARRIEQPGAAWELAAVSTAADPVTTDNPDIQLASWVVRDLSAPRRNR